ncbi:hypothetical protein [Halobacillus sp. Marseille-Q1614]|uniref:hypothetical protein n=1 Tax=Halobacillus sp. Marseille-Q1614 TaxID=2709134 RepID=UPI00157035E6|nr:hypothetical protein [Halobacillus sp. Marseille-Q1614]
MNAFKVLLLILFPVGVAGYTFRNRIVSFVAAVPVLRKFAVRTTMRIPFIRKKFMGQLFRS